MENLMFVGVEPTILAGAGETWAQALSIFERFGFILFAASCYGLYLVISSWMKYSKQKGDGEAKIQRPIIFTLLGTLLIVPTLVGGLATLLVDKGAAEVITQVSNSSF